MSQRFGGVALSDLSRFAVGRVGDTQYTVAGQELEKRWIQRSRLRFCPCCVADDLKHATRHGAALQAYWHVPFIRTCCRHYIPIFEIDKACHTRGPHDFSGRLNAAHIASKMNDYKKIRVAEKGYRKLWPSDVVARHRDLRSWLENALNTEFDGLTFVATHHAPHPSVLEDYADGVGAAYASDLGDLIRQYEPDRWFFGHCHGVRNSEVGKTRLLNVSLGYPDEVANPADRIRELIFDV